MLAFVLHLRPYKETSALVDFFAEQGRFRAVLRGARSKAGSLARPFVPLDIELRGRGELKSVARLEPCGAPHLLAGQTLFSGLYLNELLVRLLPEGEAHSALFALYEQALPLLAAHSPLEPILRSFEWRLLDELGYAFSFAQDTQGAPLAADKLYQLLPDSGLQELSQWQPGAFLGSELLAMSCANWQQPGALAAAKRLMRQALAAHLGTKPLLSRELFRRPPS